MSSILDIQRELILNYVDFLTIRPDQRQRGQHVRGEHPNAIRDWKMLIVDEYTEKVVFNFVDKLEFLKLRIMNVETLEKVRDRNEDMGAIYLIHPHDYTADCIIDDIRERRYRGAELVWISAPGQLVEKIRSMTGTTSSNIPSHQLLVDFFPRESHLVTFQDKKSFLTLFNPALDERVQGHVKMLAKRIAAVCVSLGEKPMIRRYKPRTQHDAHDLCYYLARLINAELDKYEAAHGDEWYRASNRPPGLLVVTDRSMDLNAPLLHELTYQAMAHDVLKLKDEEKVTYRRKINAGTRQEEDKDAELSEKDKIWVEMRHVQMADVLDRLQADFQKFIDDNPHFRDQVGEAKASLSTIRDMMGGLPEFTEKKETFSLHFDMVQECVERFKARRMPELALIEQTLAVGLDDSGKKPKETLEEVVRLCDEDEIIKTDRLRLIVLWILYRDGVISEDVRRLLAHADMPVDEEAVVAGLANLGFRNKADVKEQRTPRIPIFPPKAEPLGENENALTRYETVLKTLLESLCEPTNLERAPIVDSNFPFEPPLGDPTMDPMKAAGEGQSLRVGARPEPRWARSGRVTKQADNRQRLLVFVAGGATYSEARACYEVGARWNKDIYLVSSNMVTPADYLQGLRMLNWTGHPLSDFMYDPGRKKPELLTQKRQPQPPPAMQGGPSRTGRAPPRPGGPGGGGLPGRPMAPPTGQMERMNLGNGPQPGRDPGSRHGSTSSVPQRPASGDMGAASGKDKDKEKKKKKRWF